MLHTGTTKWHRPLWVLVGMIVVADQLTKAVSSRLGTHAHLVPMRNHALSLELIDGNRWVETAGMVAGLAVAVALLLPPVRSGRVSVLAAALLLGGAISNLLDRAVTGSVRDFVPIGPVVINVADVAVLTGVIGIAAALLTHLGGVSRSPSHAQRR